MRGAFALVLAAGVTGAFAGGMAAIVTERQQGMKDMAASARIIAGMFKEPAAYDQRRFRAAAETIAAHAGDTLAAQFPPETLGPPSAARAAIAEKPDEFAALARELRREAQALAEKAANTLTPAMRMGAGTEAGASSLLGRRAQKTDNLQSIPAEHVFHMMLQGCTACHAVYREKP
ncbi:cytochrome c [Mesorhizobium australicum]|uniref:Cytochrome c556 n=1 Tax=Mesorhizobium australicum TaxID=536018 RepID=A0A1X7MQ88_9HYPH|nr:cytochrome c [Mesorhizobium australicum]SMH26196.1 Cytochrome c556 [Mesorhizobium australicum]